MARIGLDFADLQDMLREMKDLGKDVDLAVENALQKSKDYVTPNLEAEMNKHIETGKTKAAIESTSTVKNDGVSAYIEVGFDISKEIAESGYPVSIFLMYGTPHMRPDKKLYNAIYGGKAKKEIQRIQEEEFYKVLNS